MVKEASGNYRGRTGRVAVLTDVTNDWKNGWNYGGKEVGMITNEMKVRTAFLGF